MTSMQRPCGKLFTPLRWGKGSTIMGGLKAGDVLRRGFLPSSVEMIYQSPGRTTVGRDESLWLEGTPRKAAVSRDRLSALSRPLLHGKLGVGQGPSLLSDTFLTFPTQPWLRVANRSCWVRSPFLHKPSTFTSFKLYFPLNRGPEVRSYSTKKHVATSLLLLVYYLRWGPWGPGW